MNERLTESFFEYPDETKNENNDFKSINNAFLYISASTNYQSDLFNFTDLDNLDFSAFHVNFKKKIFEITKIHRKKCLHKKDSRIERNKIKKLVEADAKLVFQKNLKKRFKILETIYNTNEFKIKKRLYDEDVIVKKIMSNFLKFLRLLKKEKIEISNLSNRGFFNIISCKEFLLENVSVLNFFEYFTESNYFHNYFFEKLQKNFEKNYICAFIGYIKRILI
jgi:hypothetical protein